MRKKEKLYKVFVYGTLLDRHIRQHLLRGLDTERKKFYQKSELLKGYRKERLNIVEDKEYEVAGAIIRVNQRELDKLDEYERVGELYNRITVDTENYKKVFAYQKIDPETLLTKSSPYPFRLITIQEREKRIEAQGVRFEPFIYNDEPLVNTESWTTTTSSSP